jgi:hypothetical protein
MPLERLGYFSSKIKSLKIDDFDEKIVQFLKGYTLNTMKNIRRLRAMDAAANKGIMGGINNMMNKKKEVKIDENKYIDLLLFWQIF